MNNLFEKKILLIICGGISAYKSLELIRLLKKRGAKIKTILTKSAKEFVTPLSISSLSQEKVYDDLFNVENESEMDHISLSRWSDVILVAPATANTISKLSNGSSDDFGVGFACSCVGFPCAASESVTAFSTLPNTNGLLLYFLILTHRTGILGLFLSECFTSISSYAHTITCSEPSSCACFLSAF